MEEIMMMEFTGSELQLVDFQQFTGSLAGAICKFGSYERELRRTLDQDNAVQCCLEDTLAYLEGV